MDEKRLDEIEARANATTPGPWEFGENPNGSFSNEIVIRPQGEFPHGEWIADVGSKFNDDRWRNASFIASARTDIPDLIAAVRERDKEIERIRHELCVREDEISQLRFALQRIRSAFPYGESQWFHDVAQEALNGGSAQK